MPEKLDTKFHSDESPKEGSQCIYLFVILIDSVHRTCKSYYLQVFLRECK